MNIETRIHDTICEFVRHHGDKYRPRYIVLGRHELGEITRLFQESSRFQFSENRFRTPNTFYGITGELRIIAIPIASHFSLGFDTDDANYYDQLTPYWNYK